MLEKRFELASGVLHPRIIAAVYGAEKTGKTHFALTAPAPIVFLSIDFGDEGVIQRFTGTKKIYKKEYTIPAGHKKSPDRLMEEATPVWEALKSDFLYALENARTVILDTETEAWELCRLARFGKLESVKPHNYTAVNREYKEAFIKAAYENKANVIFIQRLKKLFIDDKFTGIFEQAGFASLPFDVQVNIKTEVDHLNRFTLHVDNCRQNAKLRGARIIALDDLKDDDTSAQNLIVTPSLSFKDLAALILPQIPTEAWNDTD